MRNVVFVHGMFMTGASWAPWVERFASRGMRAIAPSWPGRDGKPSALRNAPPDALRSLTLGDVLDHYRGVIRQLDAPPVLVGHSMGGLVAQLLLQEKLAPAAVVIDPAPPQGVLSFEWSFLRSNAAVFLPTSAPIVPSLAQWTYAFAHTLPPEIAARDYDEHVVPESRLVGKGPTTSIARIDFTAARAPLLMIAGEDDHIVPASLVAKTHARYAAGPSPAELLRFAGKTHWICRMEGWEDVADEVARWIEAKA